jgi:hypothetical protein
MLKKLTLISTAYEAIQFWEVSALRRVSEFKKLYTVLYLPYWRYVFRDESFHE